MSWQDAAEARCRTHEGAVRLLIEPHTKNLGGFTVRRLLPAVSRRSVGPFVFFDHMGPADFAPGQGINVRPHPHIGLSTLTYLFEGEILHRDSLGFVQTIRPGEVNLMTAGRGIVHSERTPPVRLVDGQRLNGIQTWMALPEDLQEIEPSFEHYPLSQLPVHEETGVHTTLVVGKAWGLESPVRMHSETLYLDVRFAESASLRLPACGSELAAYVVQGDVEIGTNAVPAGSMAVVDASVDLAAGPGARVIVVGGESPGARHLFWNFVSTSRERIDAAARDWAEGRFAAVPGDDERIPLPA